ncbi:sensor histidine kinase [Oceanispirochaeta sp. M1]|nr:sensor histidine kinase [Oceanispirochaeta sp. M1]
MNYKPLFKRYFNPDDFYITRIHKKIYHHHRWKAILASLGIFIFIVLLFSDYLKISCNYFVLLPLMASAFAYGLPGGLTAGILSLPFNLLLFFLIGHNEYAPDSIFISFFSGTSVGFVMGYLSDYFRILNDEVDRRVETETRLRESLSEKDLLLSEINHRVRNNLGIISSLIQLQANRVDNSLFSDEFEKLRQRVLSISLVHEQLFMENQPLVLDIRNYLESLVSNILNTTDEYDIELVFNKPSSKMILSCDKVLHLGLLVQEIVMNSIKHAFSISGKGILSLNLKEEDEYFSVAIHDNGKGFDPDKVVHGLGSRLIESLSLSLDSHYSWDCNEGCHFIIRFPHDYTES